MRSRATLFLVLVASSCTGTIDTTLVGAVCGDGVPNGQEDCDTGKESATCDSDCTTPACGDGRVNGRFTPPGASGPEECDDGGTADGDGCSATCQLEPPPTIEPRCGDGIVGADEICDTSSDSATCDSDCTSPVCGDGHVNKAFTPPSSPTFEHCDDGGNADGDGCSATCQFEWCGNGIPDGQEQCDDGNDDDLDGCRNDCTLHVCGDGVDSVAEACDAGGDGPACDADCTLAACGDARVNRNYTPLGAPGVEQCDDGGSENGDGCSALCQIETCGNGVLEAGNGEECDDGNETDTDDCRNDCRAPRCGDGLTNGTDECDVGAVNTSICNFDCTFPSCGDGVVNRSFTPVLAAGPEECDDGGAVDGDGCSAVCQIESCGNGVTDSANGEQCDDANPVDTDACLANCQNARCGDGVVKTTAPAEPCDEGGVNSATCDFDCTLPQCGDGIVNIAAGEECDDGNTDGSDGCSVCRYSFIEALGVLNFPPTNVGMSAGTQAVVIWNPSMTESIGAIDVLFTGDPDFMVTASDCGSGLVPAQSCTISIDFVPTVAGAREGYALIGSDGLGGRMRVFVAGLGE